ncbi:hypothetical protein AaE_013745 [Aphanomyces astaci]|uniref:START domain-containing protein n=1 Tax=Aphanomyces astaci TaxID=112090 RepID=A0A6A4ZI66_APHAT|nr:hypothetical protein AaE_013745 [Aphanomyces astaci]
MLEPDPGSNHTLVDSAFRAKGYCWIISQVESKTHAALDVHKSYMGDDLQHEVKLFHGGDVVDAVRNRNVMTVLDTYAKCLWDALTMSATTSMWRVQCLEVVDAATCYTQVMVVDGISPGHPLVLNVLLKFVRESVDRHVIVLRNIAEDAKFPLPRQSIAFSVSGWIVLDRALVASGRRLGFEQNPKPATHARSLFRCRATKDSTELSIPLSPHSEGPTQPHPDDDEDTAAIMSEWLMNAIVQIFHAIESSAIQQLSTIDIKPKR